MFGAAVHTATTSMDKALDCLDGGGRGPEEGNKDPPPRPLTPHIASPVGRLVANAVVVVVPPSVCASGSVSVGDEASWGGEGGGLDMCHPGLSLSPAHVHRLWATRGFREQLSDVCAAQRMRVLPVSFLEVDSSYNAALKTVDCPDAVQAEGGGAGSQGPSLLAWDEEVSGDARETKRIRDGEDFCSVVVHPLLLQTAEEVCMGQTVWRVRREDGAAEELLWGVCGRGWAERMTLKSQDDSACCFLGKLSAARPRGGHGVPRPIGVRAAERDEGRGGGSNPLAPSVIVRVLVSDQIRPYGIHVSQEVRLCLGLSDFDAVSLRLLDPSVYPPSRPEHVTVKRIQWAALPDPPWLVSPPVGRLAVGGVDIHDVSSLCYGFKKAFVQARSWSAQQGPVVVSPTFILPVATVPRHGAAVHMEYLLVSSEGESGQTGEDGVKYCVLDKAEDFIVFVDDCCAAIERTVSMASVVPVAVTVNTMRAISSWNRSVGGTARACTGLLSLPAAQSPPPLQEIVGVQTAVCAVMGDILCAVHPRAIIKRLCEGNRVLHSPVGMLVVGEQGVGKSALIHSVCVALANSTSTVTNYFSVDCRQLVSEKIDNVCAILGEAFVSAEIKAPTVLCLDNIDALCGYGQETDSPDYDPNQVARSSKIAVHLVGLIDKCRSANRECEVAAASVFTACRMTHRHCPEGGVDMGLDGHCCTDRIIGTATCRAVYVLATASHSRNIDPLLLNIFCIGRKIVSIPSTRDGPSRVEILKYAITSLGARFHLSKLKSQASALFGASEVEAVSRLTEGFLPSDLCALARRTVAVRMTRTRDCVDVSLEDIETACASFLPQSSVSQGSPSMDPSVTFASVGGYSAVKKVLIDTFQRPVMFREVYRRSGLKLSRGVMLYGPPGTGKTLLAQAAGNVCGLAFISVRGPELLDKYIGSSEKAVRSLFERAKSIGRPCLIFFDEFESLGARRGQDTTGVTDRVVNQLLTFLDGAEDTLGSASGGGIFLVIATSRPDMVDPALIRPGRIDTHAYVGFPSKTDRIDIFNSSLTGLKTTGDVQGTIEHICSHHKSAHFTGADIKGVVSTSFLTAMQDCVEGSLSLSYDVDEAVGLDPPLPPSAPAISSVEDVVITSSHLLRAFQSTKPSLSPQDITFYENMYRRFEMGSSTDQESHGRKTAFV